MHNFTLSLKRLNFRLLSFLILLSGSLYAQQNFLEVPVRLEIEKGDMSEVVIKVKKDGKDAFTQSGASKMRFKLDYNKKYTLIFTKPGYITKTIEIDTKAPAARIENGFDPYKIGVKLFIQNDENMVIYNQPVAQIKYDQNLDEFNFNTDYSKSILSAISRDEEEEKPAPSPSAAQLATTQDGSDPHTGNSTAGAGNDTKETTTSQPAPVNIELPPVASVAPVPQSEPAKLMASTSNNPSETPPPPSVQQGVENPPPARVSGGENQNQTIHSGNGEENQRKANIQGDEDKKRTSQGNEGDDGHQKKIKTQTGEEQFSVTPNPITASDTPNGFIPADESEKITREDIVERNRVITKVRVTRKGVLTEYSRVYYSWGGLYYFKNNTMSISENLFVNWTGMRN